jgi:hypothetical protein
MLPVSLVVFIKKNRRHYIRNAPRNFQNLLQSEKVFFIIRQAIDLTITQAVRISTGNVDGKSARQSRLSGSAICEEISNDRTVYM